MREKHNEHMDTAGGMNLSHVIGNGKPGSAGMSARYCIWSARIEKYAWSRKCVDGYDCSDRVIESVVICGA